MPSKRGKLTKELTPEERKAKMNKEREFLQTFMEAALKGDGEKVHKLALEYSLEHNVTPYQVYKDLKDGSKRTALHFACSSKPEGKDEVNDDVVIHLLQKSNLKPSEIESLIMAKDADGLTPLMLACNALNEKSYERIKHILNMGGSSKVTLSKCNAGAMALHYASGSGANKDIIKLLYENGKEAISCLSAKIGSVLHWASGVPPSKDYSETIHTLITDCGVDVNVLNGEGISPLVMAAASGNDAHAKILVDAGADRGFILRGNMTVFHVAADLNLVGTLTALLQDNDDTDKTLKELTSKCLKMENEKGATPLDIACDGGHIKCVKLLAGITDDDEAKELMERTKEELKVKVKKLEEEAAVLATQKTKEGEDENAANLTPQQVATNILSKKDSISEENKKIAAELKIKGNNHYAKKEWEEAIRFYTEAINKNPADHTFYSNRSACYMAMKRHEDALYDAIIVRTLKPDWVKGCYRSSMALLALERFEDAAVSAFDGLSLDQENGELKSLFQRCIKKGKREHEANEKLKKKSGDDDGGVEKHTFLGNS